MLDIENYRYSRRGDAAREELLIAAADARLREWGAGGFNLREFEDDCLCLEWDEALWVIYFAERGGRNFVAAFPSLTAALDYMAVVTLQRFPLGLDWRALYAQAL